MVCFDKGKLIQVLPDVFVGAFVEEGAVGGSSGCSREVIFVGRGAAYHDLVGAEADEIVEVAIAQCGARFAHG